MSDDPIWRRNAGQCTATSTRSGERCQRAPVKGATVCPTHGGRAPQVKAAAAAVVAEKQVQAKALRVVQEWDPQVDHEMSPVDVLVRTMTATFQQGALHRQQLAQQASDGVDPYVRLDSSGRQYPSPLALLEQAERRMAADMSAKAISSGLAERMVRLQERQAELLVSVLEVFARELGHDPRAVEVRAAARVSLLAIEGAA